MAYNKLPGETDEQYNKRVLEPIIKRMRGY
jgi:hypothetical protein